MTESIKRTTFRGLAWSLIESVSLQAIRFLIGIILARLLMPEMFGLVAVLMIFNAFGEALLDSGFGAALIQKHTITENDICSIFYFNMCMGVLLTGLLYVLAPWIALFYNQPILTPLTRVSALIFIINSFGMIQGELLTRQVDFKTLAKVSTIATVFSGLFGILLASMGFGVWSLIWQQISSSIVRNALLWFFSPWRPKARFRIDALREMLGFGSRIFAVVLLNRTSEGLYNLVIGKVFSLADLGYFSRANQLQALPSSTLASFVTRVTFPVFSKLHDDPISLNRGFRKAFAMLVFLNFPLMIGLSMAARPLILFLLTDKWAAAIPYLQLLSCIGLILPVELLSQSMILALGRADLNLRIECIKKFALFVSLAVMWRWGIFAMIAGLIFVSVLSLYLNIRYTSMITQFKAKEQVRVLVTYFLMACATGIVVFVAGFFSCNLPPFCQLLIQIFSGFMFYLAASWLLRLSAFMDILQETRSFIFNR